MFGGERSASAPATDAVGRMSARPSLGDIDALLSDEAMAALRAHPDFSAAAEQLIAASLANYRTLDAVGRWMLTDIGRASLYMAAVILDAQPNGVSATALTAAAQGNQASSRGRVAQFIRFAQDAGEVVVPPGSEPWTRRRLTLRPAFVDRLRLRTIADASAVSRFAPEIATLIDSLEEDATYRRFLTWVGVLATHERIVGPPTPVTMFLQRRSGMRILYHLTLAQAPDRRRLLEEAAISRNQLSQLYEVSRAHINRLLADAEAAGLLSCPTQTRVVFSPALSDAFERTLAFIIQINRAAFIATLATALETEPPAQVAAVTSPSDKPRSSSGRQA
jgi:hypothetical protein